MPEFNLDGFRAQFDTGARGYLFYCRLTFPSVVASPADTEKSTYLVRSSALPGTTLGELTANWQGFAYKTAGPPTYDDISIGFRVDIKGQIYSRIANWQRYIIDPTSNRQTPPSQYLTTQHLDLLGLDGNPILRYNLYGCWPKALGDISVDYAATDFANFDVTLTYQYHTVESTFYQIPYDNPPKFSTWR